MPNNICMYFHLTGSPSEPMNVHLQTLQMHYKIIYMISCQSKGLWLKKRVSTAVHFCFCDVRKPLYYLLYIGLRFLLNDQGGL